MFKYLTGRFNFLLYTTLALAVYFILQGQANAAQECRFDSGDGGTTTLTGGTALSVHWKPYNGSAIESLVTFRVPLTPNLSSHCSMGNDGTTLFVQRYDLAPGYSSGRGPMTDGSMGQFYRTNISGILISVKIRSPAGGGYFGANGSEQVTGWTTLVEPGGTIWDGQAWEAEITLWQDSMEFVNNNGNRNNATYITPAGSFSLGKMAIGDPNDSNNQAWTFNVTPESFQVPIVQSTCQTAQLQDNSNTIDLGEFMLSDFNVSPRTQDFHIQLLGCNNVWAVDLKAISNKTSGSQNELLGNVLEGANAASGVGVKLLDEWSVPLKINSDIRTLYTRDTGSGVGLGMLNFSAQLIKDGSPLRAGDFKALATFQMTYY